MAAIDQTAASVLELIGETPVVTLDRLRGGLPGRVVLKLESANPGGSVKDRAALRSVEDAERRRALDAYGARVVLVPQAPGGVPGQVSGADLALVETRTRELVVELDAWRPDQFTNPSNALAHEETTGVELWRQAAAIAGGLWGFTAIVGTAGTFVGVSRALKSRDPAVRCVAVEPAGAPALAGGEITNPGHALQGAGYAFVPPAWDPALCDGTLTVTDEEATATARELARREGILGGFSTGANVAAALRLAATAPHGSLIATIACDTGLRYLSTDLFRDSGGGSVL